MMLKRLRNFFNRRGKKSTSAEGPAPAPVIVEQGPKVVHRPIPRSELDPDAVKIVLRLTRFEHRAYLVGGCVRDLLLERRPKDFDVGTSATPRQIKRLFRNSRIIGRRFRLAHIYFHNGKIIEVATFRAHDVEGAEDDDGGTHPPGKDILIRDDNEFGTLAEDALRRDFTINALFYDVEAETVIDHADGLSDLRRRLVRTIGDPDRRFREDPIRILRAIKFAARLDMTIEKQTLASLKRHRAELPRAAAPRILEEINRFCRGGAARRSFELLKDTGVIEILLPELRGSYEDHAAWTLLTDLLAVFDRRQREGREATTGEILAVLLLPALRGRLGWAGDASHESPRGVDVRQIVDELLRPMALRLRLARRDQEECRQILATLSRLAPLRRLRRGAKQSILRRASFGRAMEILAAVAAREGGDFDRALEHWSQAAGAAGAPRPEKAPERRERTRRRGGNRASSKRSAGVRRRAPAPASGVAWDENYFFNALPTVPKMNGEDSPDDRYGAAELAARSEEPDEDDGASRPDEEETERAPRRRRRRRGGRGRGRSRGGGRGGEG